MVDFPKDPKIDSHDLFDGIKMIEVKLKDFTSIPDSLPLWAMKQYVQANLQKFQILVSELEEELSPEKNQDVMVVGMAHGTINCLEQLLTQFDSLYFHALLEALQRAKQEMEK